MDPAARRCTAGGEQVRLTAKEFGVLECLARRPDQAIPKGEILDAVWDSAFRGDLNIVEVYVSALRRKLARTAARCEIETVRGIGYRLVPLRGAAAGAAHPPPAAPVRRAAAPG
ncbi:winged helix-turn-helix domain-containing protein [Streptomyces sp. CBMA123]|uniref:winged helix-turn-helix domain-containing protein n=1 Tax=Streptomyces sp. CBMA123 TaxID=1896313 RepID=UPI001D335130|nr:hypothetical protein [Streptomyces sp. CBMA123]